MFGECLIHHQSRKSCIISLFILIPSLLTLFPQKFKSQFSTPTFEYKSSKNGLPDKSVSCPAIEENENKWIGIGWIVHSYGSGNGLSVFNEKGKVSFKDQENKNEHYSDKLTLSQNFPNPFNPSTTIRYTILKQSYVTLTVYVILGCEVAALVNEEKPAGNYEIKFNVVETHLPAGRQGSHASLPSGIYFYQIKAAP